MFVTRWGKVQLSLLESVQAMAESALHFRTWMGSRRSGNSRWSWSSSLSWSSSRLVILRNQISRPSALGSTMSTLCSFPMLTLHRAQDRFHRRDIGAIPIEQFDEFLRRFLLHILPQGFVRIRNFGFLANRRRATLLPLCFHLLGSAQQQQPQAEQNVSSTKDSSDLWHCPECRPMKVIERLTAAEIQLRSSPSGYRCTMDAFSPIRILGVPRRGFASLRLPVGFRPSLRFFNHLLHPAFSP